DSGTFTVLQNANGDSAAVDQTYASSAYLGYQASFTSTRREGFKLDYLLVRQYADIPFVPDPLEVEAVAVQDDTTLRVVFDRAVDSASGADPANYFPNTGARTALAATVAGTAVELAFADPLVSASYLLAVDNVTDTDGVAVAAGTTMAFSCVAPPAPEVKLARDDTARSAFFDDFSTGIGTHWRGDTATVHIVAGRLRPDTAATSPTVIHAPSERVRNTVWEAGVDVDGALSGRNFVRLYLAASDGPTGPHQGYHIQIDGSAGNHSYRLWRQNGATRTSVFQSVPLPNQDGKFRARVRVACDADGQWTL